MFLLKTIRKSLYKFIKHSETYVYIHKHSHTMTQIFTETIIETFTNTHIETFTSIPNIHEYYVKELYVHQNNQTKQKSDMYFSEKSIIRPYYQIVNE